MRRSWYRWAGVMVLAAIVPLAGGCVRAEKLKYLDHLNVTVQQRPDEVAAAFPTSPVRMSGTAPADR